MAREKSSKAPREKTTRKVTPGATVKKKAIARSEKAVTSSNINGRSVFFAPLERLPCSDDTLRTAISDITERKRAEEVLRTSEEQFRRAIEDAPIPMIMHAEDGQVLQISRTWTELTGFRAEDMQTFEAWLNRAYGEGADAVREHVRQLFKGTRRSINVDFPIRTKDDRIRHWSFSASAPGTLVDGRRFVVGMANDVTERKKAEEELRLAREVTERHAKEMEVRNEELLRTQMDLETMRTEYSNLFNFAPVGYFTFDERGNISAANVTGASQLGVERASLLRQPFAQSVVEEDRPRFMAHLKEVFGSAERKECELRLLGKDHSVLFVRMESVALDEGFEGRVRCLTAVNDITARKKAEKALRESEKRLRLAQQIAHVGTFDWNIQTRVNTWTPELEAMYGLKAGQFGATQPAWEELLHPEDRAEAVRLVNRALATGEVTEGEWRVVWPDGSIHWLAGKWQAFKDRAGNPLHMTGVNIDITERKQAEEAARAISDRYRSYIELTGQLGWTTNADGEVVEDMPSWRAFTGQTHDEVSGWGWSKALHPDDLERTAKRWKNAVAEKSAYEVEYRIRRHDGIYRHFMARGIPLFKEDGSIREWVGTCIDITERKNSEEILRRAKDELEVRVRERTEELVKANKELEEEIAVRRRAEKAVIEQSRILESFFMHSHTCLVFLDRDFNFIRVNEAYARACAKEVSDFIGHNHFVDYPSDELQQKFQRVVGTKEPYTVYGRPFVFPDHPEWGVTYWDLAVAPILDSKGEVEFLVFSLLDVTERKRAEEKIKSLNRELEQRVKARTAELESVNRELEAFSYTVSHDLKTPLRSIEGFTRALMEDYAGKLDDAGRDYLDRVNAASKRMSQLIEAMLTISRLTKGELLERTVNLSDMAQVKADELKRKEPGRKVEFIIAQGLKARGDHSMLALVVENLLENAWKFTGRHESATIEFGVTQREGQTVYYVRDDGAGFDMDYADKLFLPFRRLHLESEFPGLGIGLATVYRIISRHGGKIWAEGAPEKGATVYFSLG